MALINLYSVTGRTSNPFVLNPLANQLLIVILRMIDN